jgi:ribonuclease P protein component
MDRIRRRADFLAAAQGNKVSGSAFVLQARSRSDERPPRFGITVTKKVGNAVERNRVRRRLREMVRISAVAARAGHDYVVIGRRAALTAAFAQMLEDFARAMRTVHEGRIGRRRRSVAAQLDRRPPAKDEIAR